MRGKIRARGGKGKKREKGNIYKETTLHLGFKKSLRLYVQIDEQTDRQTGRLMGKKLKIVNYRQMKTG